MPHQIRPAGPLHGTTATFKHSDTKTEVTRTGCILLFSLSQCLTLSVSLFLYAGEWPEIKNKKKSLKLGTCIYFSFSLADSCLPEKHPQREKELGRTAPTFQFATGSKPVLSPASLSFLLLKRTTALILRAMAISNKLLK